MKKTILSIVSCLSLLIGWMCLPAAAAAGTVLIQDFSGMDPKVSKDLGTFQDDKGSKITLETKGKGSKGLVLHYTLIQGGYCGLWCRAGGQDWSGVDLSAAKEIRFSVHCKSPVELGLALKDKNNNQYTAKAPATKGGSSWETISVPLDSFQLDPYYTPPDALKGAPRDLSQVKTFNLQAQTAGSFTVEVREVTGQ